MFYDGYDFSGLLTVERVGRSLLPDVSVETASVPGKDGGVFRSASVGMLSLSVDVRIVVPTPGTRNQKAAFESARRKAAGLLLKRGPRPLVVDDAPDLEYEAILSGSTDLDRFVYMGGTTLEFLCANPWGVGRSVEREASPSLSEDGTVATVALVRANVGGNYPTAPVVSFDGSEASYEVLFDGVPFDVYANAGGGPVEIDCARRKATQSGKPVTVDINSDWPSWEPGVHLVSSLSPFTVSWSERWV